MLLTAVPIGATPYSTAFNVNTDAEPYTHVETAIAVNPKNPLNMIGAAVDYQSSLDASGNRTFANFSRARTTFNGGRTWSTYLVPTTGDYDTAGDPSVSFDADGTAYMSRVALNKTEKGPNGTRLETADSVILSHSGDGGRTWSNSVVVAAGSGFTGSKQTDQDKPYVAAWGHGNAIITWGSFNFDRNGDYINSPIFASITHDGGKKWSVGQRISGSLGIDQFATPTVAADGSIYVGFQTIDNLEGLSKALDRYEVVRVDPCTGLAISAPVSVGEIYDAANNYPVSAGGEQTLQDSQMRINPGNGNITADPTNPKHLAVVWADTRNNPYHGAALPSTDPYKVKTNSDVIVSQSFNRGLSWSSPVAVAKPNDQFMPWGAYDAHGRLQIGYFDRSYDPANHKYGYTLASENTSGSLKFHTREVTTVLSDPTKGVSIPSFGITANPNFPRRHVLPGRL